MLELEEAFHASSVNVVRNRRTSERNRLPKNISEATVQAVKLCPFQVSGHPAGADAGAEETLIGIDISHSVQQFLIQQGGFDRGPATPEERGEVVLRDV